MAAGEFRDSAVVSAGGTATITIKVRNGIDRWTVTQVTPELPGAPAGARGELRKNGSLVTPFVAAGDPIGGDPPVFLDPGDTLTIEWTGCTAGSVAKVLAFYDDGK